MILKTIVSSKSHLEIQSHITPEVLQRIICPEGKYKNIEKSTYVQKTNQGT